MEYQRWRCIVGIGGGVVQLEKRRKVGKQKLKLNIYREQSVEN